MHVWIRTENDHVAPRVLVLASGRLGKKTFDELVCVFFSFALFFSQTKQKNPATNHHLVTKKTHRAHRTLIEPWREESAKKTPGMDVPTKKSVQKTNDACYLSSATVSPPLSWVTSLQHEDHTLGQPLTQRLREHPSVMFAAYRRPQRIKPGIDIDLRLHGNKTDSIVT